MPNLGFIRVAAATPKLKIANTEFNAEQIIECNNIADESGCGLVVFPELCITGATCGDLFYQDFLYTKSLESLSRILKASEKTASAIVLGLYIEHGANRLNCAALIQSGSIKGLSPKTFLSGPQLRWFSPICTTVDKATPINFMGGEIPFGNLLYKDSATGIALGVEVSGDTGHIITPGALLSLHGAEIIASPCASHDTAGGTGLRRTIVAGESRKNICAYAVASAGVHESTTDKVYGGQNLIAENGVIISESGRFKRESSVLYGDIDFELIRFERKRVQSHNGNAAFYAEREAYLSVPIEPLRLFDSGKQTPARTYPKNPFIPDSPVAAAEHCSEIFEIQCAGLAKRIEHTHAVKAVIGVSGGVDSALALLVCANTFKMLGKNTREIVSITMPGFGTTDQTHENALEMMKALGTDTREISITDSVIQHFKDIGHDPNNRDVTYENAQARERTQILMDIANKENGIVIGTGDLSESALGWSTYCGDHMSMYNVNAGVPKTLVKRVLRWIIDHKLNGPLGDKSFSSDNTALSYAIDGALSTPVSPELLPAGDSGDIAQKTEDMVGPYELNDFFIYYTLKCGFSPVKLLHIANLVFAGEYSNETIKKWLSAFYKRFFRQQFKRSCMPDGPETGPVSLSPRGGLYIPSDADDEMWAIFELSE